MTKKKKVNEGLIRSNSTNDRRNHKIEFKKNNLRYKNKYKSLFHRSYYLI